MIRSTLTVSILFLFATSASADEICHDMQVCEEVCTEISFEPIDAEPDLSYRAIPPGGQIFDLPMHCETACTFEEFCYPRDTTGGDYDTDDIDRCYREQLLVDQIRCIQMLGA